MIIPVNNFKKQARPVDKLLKKGVDKLGKYSDNLLNLNLILWF